MARRIKQNIVEGVDRRETGYFSTPDFVADFISHELLSQNPNGQKVLDPCVGKEELLTAFIDAEKRCEGYDILQMKESYRVNFNNRDFIGTFIDDSSSLKAQCYDYIIMNPPYNCHECGYIVSNKKLLHQHFNIGVYNMAALFLSATIDIAPDGSLIGAIVPDAILVGRAYEKLRKKILKDCTILEVLLCPGELFRSQVANVSTCILILKKGKDFNSTETVLTLDRPTSSESFKELLKSRSFTPISLNEIIYDNAGECRLVIGASKVIKKMITAYPSLGSLFKCGGGISTGNDKVYTRKLQENGYSVPIMTNPASSRFMGHPKKYLCDDFEKRAKSDKGFIIRNKEYLYREGIAFSSVGKHFSAVFLPKDTVTGVNAAVWPPIEDIPWLLAYMNSSFITYVAKAIYDRGNMTTIRCVQSLPVIDFDAAEKKALSNICQNVLNGMMPITNAIEKIDEIVFNRLGIDTKTISKVMRFCSDLTHKV